MLTAQCQTGPSTELIVSADLRAIFVMLTASCLGIEPQALLLGFLTTQQTGEMLIDFLNEFVGEFRWSERMASPESRSRGIQHDGRTDAQAAQTTTVARQGWLGHR